MNQPTTTLIDVCKKLAGIGEITQFFGASAKFQKKFSGLCLTLAKTIAKEQGITMEQAQKLPPETKLGKKAQKKFAELLSWVERNN
jgi:hypothetical protein